MQIQKKIESKETKQGLNFFSWYGKMLYSLGWA